MGKRTANSDTVRLVARRLGRMRAADGPVVVDDDGVFVVAARELVDPRALAELVLSCGGVSVGGHRAFARCWRDADARAVDEAYLAVRSQKMAEIRAVPRLAKLVSSGHRELRSWRGVDLDAVIRGWTERSGQLRRVYEACVENRSIPAPGIDLRSSSALGPVTLIRRIMGEVAAAAFVTGVEDRDRFAVTRREALGEEVRAFLRLARWADRLAADAADEEALQQLEACEPAERETCEGLARRGRYQFPVLADDLLRWLDSRGHSLSLRSGDIWPDLTAPEIISLGCREVPAGLFAERLLAVTDADDIVGEAERIDVLAAILARPAAPLRLPMVDSERLAWLSAQVTQRPEAWSQALLDAAGEAPREPWSVGAALDRGVAADALAPLVRAGVNRELDQVTSTRGAERVVGVLDALAGEVVARDWLVRLAQRGGAAAGQLALASVASPDGRLNVGHLEALSRALVHDDYGLTEALAVLEAPGGGLSDPERRVCELTGISEAALAEFVHHRTLAGKSRRLSNALRRVLEHQEEREREVRWLRDAAVEQPELSERLTMLTDPAVTRAREQKLAARARRTFERARAATRQDALDAVIEPVFRRAVSRVLGREVGPLTRGIWDAFLLLQADDVDLDLARELLDDALAARPLAARPLNARWLERQDFDTARWVAGFERVVVIDGRKIRIATEADPLAVLRMGSWFDTCLSLGSGCNAASTLANALDINKHVLFATLEDGRIVGRKLIGVTEAGALIGYHSYASEVRSQLAAALDRAAAEFGEALGLPLTVRGAPRSLHGAFWYDDGAVSFNRSTPDDLGVAQVMREVLRNDRFEWLRWLADADHARAAATVGVLLATRPSTLRALVELCPPWLLPEQATLDIVGRGRTLPCEAWEDAQRYASWLGAPPLGPGGARLAARRVASWRRRGRALRGNPCWCEVSHFVRPPTALAWLSTSELTRVLEAHLEVQDHYVSRSELVSIEPVLGTVAELLDAHARLPHGAPIRSRHPVMREAAERVAVASGWLNPRLCPVGLDAGAGSRHRMAAVDAVMSGYVDRYWIPAYLHAAEGLAAAQLDEALGEPVRSYELPPQDLAIWLTVAPERHHVALLALVPRIDEADETLAIVDELRRALPSSGR